MHFGLIFTVYSVMTDPLKWRKMRFGKLVQVSTSFCFSFMLYFTHKTLHIVNQQTQKNILREAVEWFESRTRNPKVVSSSLGPAGIVGGGSECPALSSTFNTMTEVPLSKAPNPQLLPGRRSINGCPLLRVCVCVCSLLCVCTWMG